MQVNGQSMRTIWANKDGSVGVIDQTRLPHEFVILQLETLEDAAAAITTMVVRGAPLIGATAAYGLYLGLRTVATDRQMQQAVEQLTATRPTAGNLQWALNEMVKVLAPLAESERSAAALQAAAKICDDDVQQCSRIGDHGLELFRSAHTKHPDRPLQVLTHCNAGWLATVDWGTALAPIYKAHNAGVDVHVWVDETRPRNQGLSLTAWELGCHGVPHTVITDNTGGHLMQHGLVDLCIVGSDRTTSNGDVANKIGTYLKALAAHDNGIPFYVALPHSTIDWSLTSGNDIPIEQRDATEVTHVTGKLASGEIATVQLTPDSSEAANYAFDVTPGRLVTALITERGVCEASTSGLQKLYPEKYR